MEFELRGPITVHDERGEKRRFEGPVTVEADVQRQVEEPVGEMASGSSAICCNCSSSSSSELGELGELGDLSVGELVERARRHQRG